MKGRGYIEPQHVPRGPTPGVAYCDLADASLGFYIASNITT
jgi:hypothetical protein